MSNYAKRALILAPTPTWPQDFGNRKRILKVCNGLKKLGYEIHYIHYASEGDWRNNLPFESRIKMNEQWDLVDHIVPTVPLHEWPKHGDDHYIDEWWDPALENHLKWLFEARNYDLFVVNYTWLSRALEFAPDCTLKVLDTHDKFSGRRQLLEANGISKEFFHTTESEETKGLNRADLVWAIKEEEKKLFDQMDIDAEVRTLIHVDDQRENVCPYQQNQFVTFGFIGARNNINKVNLENFLKVAEPIFDKYLPPLQIQVAGSVCKEFESEQSKYVDFVGYVDTVDSFYDAIDVALVPMEFSTGLKIKAGEAIALSKPLIAHKHAMEGYPQVEPLHLCESFEEIALAMCELAYEPQELGALSQKSLDAYEICQFEIDSELEYLDSLVLNQYEVVVNLPQDFGNEKSIWHWVTAAHIEWLGWSNKVKCITQYPPKFDSYKSNIYYLEQLAYEQFINQTTSKIYNLDFSLIIDSQLSPLAVTDSSKVLPLLGHKASQMFDNIKDVEVNGVITLGNDNKISMLADFLKMKNEEVQYSKITCLDETEKLINKIVFQQTVPRLCIAKAEPSQSLPEKVFIELCRSLGIKIIYSDDYIDVRTCNACLNSNFTTYNNTFFSEWESFEKAEL